jgi:uridine phosphorylase
MHEKLDTVSLRESIERGVKQVQMGKPSFDINSYLGRRLPVTFPNKGISQFRDSAQQIEVHHELIEMSKLISEVDRGRVESVIDFYGSSHQREYCYMVCGHRFEGAQTIQFRGVLGLNRLYKLILMLRLLGISSDQISLVDHDPQYVDIVEADLERFPGSSDLVIVGGQVALRSLLASEFSQVERIRGNIVSYGVYTYNKKTIVMTSFPYGDLCETVVRCLATKGMGAVAFVGSAGALSESLQVGDIIAPRTVVNDEGTELVKRFSNRLRDPGLVTSKPSDRHGNVKTPLLETDEVVTLLRRMGCETVDVEALHFQQGCERWFPEHLRIGILLYVIDKPFSQVSLAQHDYSLPRVMDVRRTVASLIKDSIDGDIWR